MNSFAFFACVFAIFGNLNAAPREEGDLADKVQKVVDQILSVIPESIALKNDVIDFPKNDIENGKITIGEISLTGLKALETQLSYKDDSSRLDYTFNWGDIAFVFDVTTQLEGIIDLEHHLSVKVEIKDLKNEGYATVSEDPKEVTDLDLLVSVAEVSFDIEGLFNNDELSQKVSEFLTNNVAAIINEINPLIAPYFSKIVKDIINVALKLES